MASWRPSNPLVTRSDAECTARQSVLQQFEADSDPLPFDDRAAQSRTTSVRTSSRNERWSAAKIAERLPIVGLPEADSIRCRLFAGRCTSATRASNPTVTFTRSRGTSFAVSGSPLTNNRTATSSSACTYAGSSRTRSEHPYRPEATRPYPAEDETGEAAKTPSRPATRTTPP